MGCPMKVAPFRDPRVNGRLLLSAAFRSLLRLSSAFSAKAFPSCLVLDRRDGKHIFYTLNPDALGELHTIMGTIFKKKKRCFADQ